MRLSRLVPVLAIILATGACKRDAIVPTDPNVKTDIAIEEARLVLPVLSGNPAAAYFTIDNQSDETVKVLSVEVAGANMAMLHETMNMGGMSKMQMIQDITIAPHEKLVFAPGGKHVMVTGLSSDLKPRTMTRLTINFDDGDRAVADLPVIPPAVANQ